jgi:undecaprenyl-diphosphatase
MSRLERLRGRGWIVVGLLAIGLGLLVFFSVAEELLENELGGFDAGIIAAIAPWRSPWRTQAMAFVSNMAVLPWAALYVVPMVLFLAGSRRYVPAIALAVVPLLTAGLVLLLKAAFGRARPVGGIIVETGHSFPSAHAIGSMVTYGLLAYVMCRYVVPTRWGRVVTVLLAAVLIILTGLSRVYLGVHFPSDVLAGWAAGLAILAAAILGLEEWDRQAAPA